MDGDVHRMRPPRRTLVALVGAVWELSFGAVREFVWADLRDGLIRTAGLPRITRNLIRLGLVLVVAMLGVLLFSDVLRGTFPLIAGTGATVGRGELVPTILLPFTMFMITVAWSLLLTGGVHSHPAIRVVILVAYLGTTIGWMSGGLFDAGAVTVIAWVALTAVPVVFAVRWRAALRPALEYPLFLSLVGIVYVVAQRQLVATFDASGVPLFVSSVETTIRTLGFLVTPLLILIGLDIADFAYRAAGWAVALVNERFGRATLLAAFAAVAVWRLRSVGQQAVAAVAENGAAGYLGGLVVPVIVVLAWLLVRRLRRAEDADPDPAEVVESALHNGGNLAVGYVGWQVVLTLGTFVLLAVLAIVGVGAESFIASGLALIQRALAGDAIWRVAFAVVVLGIGLLLARRGHRGLPLYLAIVGAVELWLILTDEGGPFDVLLWSGRAPITFWWTVVVVAAAVYLLARRRLTIEALQGLLTIALITTLAGGADAVADPFSPFFAFAGVALIAFGILWDAITIGSWANLDSPALPRPNRMILYLGYVLFSVTVINWALATHNLSSVDFLTSGAATLGFEKFGVPLLYAIYVIILGRVLGLTPAPAEPGQMALDLEPSDS